MSLACKDYQSSAESSYTKSSSHCRPINIVEDDTPNIVYKQVRAHSYIMPGSKMSQTEHNKFDDSKAYVPQEAEGKAFVGTPMLGLRMCANWRFSSTTAER